MYPKQGRGARSGDKEPTSKEGGDAGRTLLMPMQMAAADTKKLLVLVS